MVVAMMMVMTVMMAILIRKLHVTFVYDRDVTSYHIAMYNFIINNHKNNSIAIRYYYNSLFLFDVRNYGGV